MTSPQPHSARPSPAPCCSYGEWYEFACAQRAHYNYVEAFGPVVSFLLTGGLAFPRTAAALGLVYAYGRRNYARSYAGAGPDKRYGGQLAPWSLIGAWAAGERQAARCSSKPQASSCYALTLPSFTPRAAPLRAGLLGLFGVCLASGAQISGLTDAVKGFVTQRLSA